MRLLTVSRAWKVLLALCVLISPASFTTARGAESSDLPYNVLLVTPDQMAADFLHTYGYPLPDTPNLDQWAKEGTVFLHAYSAGSWTTPSFGAIFSGLFPTVHGMTLPPPQGCGVNITHPLISGTFPVLPDYLTLSPNKLIAPQMLKKHGAATGAIFSNCWAFWDVVSRDWDSFKFLPGYEQVVPGYPDLNNQHYLTAPNTLAEAQKWLTAHRDQRFFLWVHFMEPHTPYNPPAEYDQYKTPEDFPDLSDASSAEGLKLRNLAALGNAHAIRRLSQLYAGKILFVDHYLGELSKTIRDLGLDKNTIVILVSDHGQLLYSHPEDFNTDDHRSQYDADLHVPLIFWGPGVLAGRRVEAIAAHYDILPTILDLEGLPAQPAIDGTSLKPVLMGKEQNVHPYVFGEETAIEPQYSIRNSQYKLIESLRSGKIQCFDNINDPAEKKDICLQIPGVAAKLKQELDIHIQKMIEQAKSYPDWKDNLALAVVEQRDTRGLRELAADDQIVTTDSGEPWIQLNGQIWLISPDTQSCQDACYWAPPGPDTASVIWRFDTPLVGEYEVSVKYGAAGQPGKALATNANFTVQFKGGTLSFPVDQNQNQGRWNLLGRFYDPIQVELTNQANGPVVAGAVRFVRTGK